MPSRYVRFSDGLKAMNPSFEYHLLNEKDAEELSGRSWDKLKNTFGSYVSISNYVRLISIYLHGGIYLDLDFEAVKPLDPLLQHSAFAAVSDNTSVDGSPNRICPAAFGAEAKHPWLKWQLDRWNKYPPKDPNWGVTLMSVAPREGITLVPTATFFPFHWDSKPEDRVPQPETIAIHHWDGDWRDCK